MIPERTVSRYHCLLEISPPRVRLQDFGSLNGTFLSGRKIGQRDRDISWEEAKDLPHEVFELKDGDVLGLGSQCEITCRIQRGEVCALCGKDLPRHPSVRAAAFPAHCSHTGHPPGYQAAEHHHS